LFALSASFFAIYFEAFSKLLNAVVYTAFISLSLRGEFYDLGLVSKSLIRINGLFSLLTLFLACAYFRGAKLLFNSRD